MAQYFYRSNDAVFQGVPGIGQVTDTSYDFLGPTGRGDGCFPLDGCKVLYLLALLEVLRAQVFQWGWVLGILPLFIAML